LKKGIGLKDQIKIVGREIQIATGNDPNKDHVTSEVFEKGQFLFSNQNPYKYREERKTAPSDEYIRKLIRRLHDETIDEIQVLFYVHDKLKLLKQYIPHFRLARVFYAKGFFPEAVENLETAVNLKKDYIPSYKLLGISYLMLNNYEKAAEVFLAAHKLKPKYPDLLNCLGVTYAQLKDTEKAAQYVQQAIDLSPDYLEANLNLGIILFISTLKDDSEEENVIVPARLMKSFKKIKSHTRYQSDYWQKEFNSLISAIESGKRNKILIELKRMQVLIVTTKDDNTIMDYFFLKFMYGSSELSKQELEFYESMIKKEVQNRDVYADFWNELGVIHLIQCRDFLLQAISDFEKAISVNPKFEDAIKNFDNLKHNKNGFLILLRAILR